MMPVEPAEGSYVSDPESKLPLMNSSEPADAPHDAPSMLVSSRPRHIVLIMNPSSSKAAESNAGERFLGRALHLHAFDARDGQDNDIGALLD